MNVKRPPGGESGGSQDIRGGNRPDVALTVARRGDTGLFKLPDDPTEPSHALGDLGPRRGPRRRTEPVFGLPSTFSLTRKALERETARCRESGWREWEIKTRFAEPLHASKGLECPGEFGPGGRWQPHCGDAT
jgi:hypothetical protein